MEHKYKIPLFWKNVQVLLSKTVFSLRINNCPNAASRFYYCKVAIFPFTTGLFPYGKINSHDGKTNISILLPMSQHRCRMFTDPFISNATAEFYIKRNYFISLRVRETVSLSMYYAKIIYSPKKEMNAWFQRTHFKDVNKSPRNQSCKMNHFPAFMSIKTYH